MARIPYVSRETMPDGRTDLYDRLVRERGANLENIFLALANVPDLAEAVLGMATALRKQTTLPRVFRELAVVTVGLEANASYEVDHHWNAALNGCPTRTARTIARVRDGRLLQRRGTFGHPAGEGDDAGRARQRRDLGRDVIPRATTTDGAAVDHCLVQLRRAHHPAAGNRERAVVRASIGHDRRRRTGFASVDTCPCVYAATISTSACIGAPSGVP